MTDHPNAMPTEPLSAEELAKLNEAAATGVFDFVFNNDHWEVSGQTTRGIQTRRFLETLAQLTAERDGLQKQVAELSETYIDDTGLSWSPPTAWAYYAVCKARDSHAARAERAEAERDGWRSVILDVAGMLDFREPLEHSGYTEAEMSSGGLAENFKLALDEIKVERDAALANAEYMRKEIAEMAGMVRAAKALKP